MKAPSVVPSPPEDAPTPVDDAWRALQSGDPGTARRRIDELGGGRLGAPGRAAEGFLAYLVGDVAEAERQFRAALAAHEDFAPALYGMGLVSQEREDANAATIWYRRALDVDPSLSQAGVALEILELERARDRVVEARQAERQGRIDEAIAAYREALELAPRLAGSYLGLAELLASQGRREQAVSVLDRGRERTVPRPALLAKLGDLYLRLEEYAAAVDVLNRARELAPDDAAIARAFDEARSRYETHSLPEEYRRLRSDPVIHREDLAAMVAIGLRPFLEDRVEEEQAIVVDVEDSWATDYIHEVVSWGIMDVFDNHAFLPGLPVSRGMLANVVYEVLRTVGMAEEGVTGPAIEDVPSQHVFYRPIQVAVGFGLMELDDRGRFGDLLVDVEGEEAFQAIEGLRRLLRTRLGRPDDPSRNREEGASSPSAGGV